MSMSGLQHSQTVPAWARGPGSDLPYNPSAQGSAQAAGLAAVAVTVACRSHRLKDAPSAAWTVLSTSASARLTMASTALWAQPAQHTQQSQDSSSKQCCLSRCRCSRSSHAGVSARRCTYHRLLAPAVSCCSCCRWTTHQQATWQALTAAVPRCLVAPPK
jgi:hypothetical protein